MKNVLCKNIFLYFLCLPALLVIGGCNKKDSIDVSRYYTNPDSFASLTNGMDQTEVFNILGSSGSHGFTISENSKVHLLTSYMFPGGSSISLVFENGRLSRFVNPVFSDNLREEYEYMGKPATRIRCWSIEETYDLCIRPTLNAEAQSMESIQERISADPYESEYSQFPPWLVGGLKRWMLPKLKEAYRKNAALSDRYDGTKVALGMRADNVNNLFGQPLSVHNLSRDKIVRIYGDDIELSVNPQFHFSCVAVVFKEKKVITVISGMFFCREWLRSEDALL